VATISWYLSATTANSWRTIDESTASAGKNTDGWVVASGSTNHSEYAVGVERAASTFTGTDVPNGTLNTSLFDAFRTTNAYTGNFASANWSFIFSVQATTNGGAQDGRIRFRLIKADADGSNATEITSGQQQASLVSDVATTGTFESSLTFNPGAFSLANQYLFVQIAWERTGAGGMVNSDINWILGSDSSTGTRITSSDFTIAVDQDVAASETVAVSGTGTLGATGSVAASETVSISGSATVENGDLRAVFINDAASDTGRQVHPWTAWTDTAITLGAIDTQSISGTTFYWKVRTGDNLESAWFGPVTINAAADQDVAASTTLAITGAAALTASGSVASSGTIAITGVATTSATGTVAASGDVAISGTGTASAAGTVAATGSLAITGSGTTTATGSVASSGAIAIAGSGTTSATGSVAASGELSISGSGTATDSASSDITASGSITISGSAALKAAGSVAAAGSLAISGSGTTRATGTVAASGTASISGAASATESEADDVTASATLSISGSAAVTATGSITAAGSLTLVGGTDLDGAGTLSAAGSLSVAGASTLKGVGEVRATPTLTLVGGTDLDAIGSMTASGTLEISGYAEVVPEGSAGNLPPYIVVRMWIRTA